MVMNVHSTRNREYWNTKQSKWKLWWFKSKEKNKNLGISFYVRNSKPFATLKNILKNTVVNDWKNKIMIGDIISILAYVVLFHKFTALPPHLAVIVIKIIYLKSNKNLCS